MISRSTDIAGALRSRQRGFFLNPFRFGAPAFSPLDLPDLQGWYDASDASTRTLTSGKVSQWRDKSGNANHANQSLATNRYSVAAGSVNGLDAFTGTGAQEMPLTSYVTPASGLLYIFAVGGNTNTSHGTIFGKSTSTTNYYLGILPYSPGFLPDSIYNNSDGIYVELTGLGSAAANGSINLMSCVCTGAGRTAGFNGLTASDAYVTTAPVTGLTGYQVSPTGLTGTVCEMIVGVGALTAPQIASVKSYLKTKWGTP